MSDETAPPTALGNDNNKKLQATRTWNQRRQDAKKSEPWNPHACPVSTHVGLDPELETLDCSPDIAVHCQKFREQMLLTAGTINPFPKDVIELGTKEQVLQNVRDGCEVPVPKPPVQKPTCKSVQASIMVPAQLAPSKDKLTEALAEAETNCKFDVERHEAKMEFAKLCNAKVMKAPAKF